VVVEARRTLTMGVTLRWCRTDDIDTVTEAAWNQLAERALDPNPFAAPGFVLPAARWLTPEQTPWIALIERHDHVGRELIGAGCFTPQKPDLFVPVPHLRSYQTLHTFRSGLLCAPGESHAVAEALLVFLNTHHRRWHAITFQNLRADCPVLQALQEQPVHGSVRWFERQRFMRPCLRVAADVKYDSRIPASERKDLNRRQRRLNERGTISSRILQADAANAAAVQTHLRLEHAGWKGKAGTSMLSSKAQTGFFIEMMESFKKTGNAVFAETLCDGKVIASTSNMVLGNILNGFKTGWDPGYAAASPGRLNELHLFRSIQDLWPGVTSFDSQSQEDSYLADLLPDREVMVTGTVAIAATGLLAMRAARVMRPLAYRLDRDT
jgi:hypothetical protein